MQVRSQSTVGSRNPKFCRGGLVALKDGYGPLLQNLRAERPNEQFSGKGHKIHVCQRCRAKPKTERRAIEDQDDIFRFLQQSHISEKNVIRLRQMEKSDNPQVASLAEIVLEVARLKPYKTRRLKFLAQKHPQLLRKLEATGMIFAHTWDWESSEVFAQSNSEEVGVIVPEDGEVLSMQEDWEIPF